MTCQTIRSYIGAPTRPAGHHAPALHIYTYKVDWPPGGAWSPGPSGAAEPWHGMAWASTQGREKRPARTRRMAGPERASLSHSPGLLPGGLSGAPVAPSRREPGVTLRAECAAAA